MSLALIYSLGVCVLSVALEGLFAGGSIKQRLATLQVPRHVPPLWGWIVIGVFYYVICFILLYRLLSMPTLILRQWALALLGGMMFINAFWNYFFFRSRNLFHAYLIGLPYCVIAVVLFSVLLRLDRLLAWVLLPYLFYLIYAARFGYSVWKLNQPPSRNISSQVS